MSYGDAGGGGWGQGPVRRPSPPPARPAEWRRPVELEPPTEGICRQVCGPDGEPVAIEVWTGVRWLQLQHVRHVASGAPAWDPVITVASVVIAKCWPAPGGRPL